MSKAKPTTRLPMLNGVSVSKLELEQNGDLHVEFDLPTPNELQTLTYRTDILARRSFDVYDDPELREAAAALFKVVRARLQVADPERQDISCMNCKASRCCREYDVFVEAADVAVLREHLGLSEKELVALALDPKPDWTGDYPYRLRKDEDEQGDKCVFLKPDAQSGQMRCSVYAARPALCRSFDERDCRLYDDNGKRLDD